MAVRKLQEMGENLQKIMNRLFENQNLLKLLYYTDKDPLSQKDLTSTQIQNEVFEKLIKIIPRVGPKETANSIVAFRVVSGDKMINNSEYSKVEIDFEIFVPLTQWFIKNESLRPFLIMSEIEKSLDGKTVNGLGKMSCGGFSLNFLTEEISCYDMNFSFTTYD